MRSVIGKIVISLILCYSALAFAQGSVTYDDVIRGAVKQNDQSTPSDNAGRTGTDWQKEYEKVRRSSPSGYRSNDYQGNDLDQYTVDGVIDVNRIPDSNSSGRSQNAPSECGWVSVDTSTTLYGTHTDIDTGTPAQQCVCGMEIVDPRRCY